MDTGFDGYPPCGLVIVLLRCLSQLPGGVNYVTTVINLRTRSMSMSMSMSK